MFNWVYALIGVLIGMVVEPVGRGINHGPGSAPFWTYNPLSRLIVSFAVFGFIIFSASFGIKYGIYAILEIIAGTFISYFIARK